MEVSEKCAECAVGKSGGIYTWDLLTTHNSPLALTANGVVERSNRYILMRAGVTLKEEKGVLETNT